MCSGSVTGPQAPTVSDSVALAGEEEAAGVRGLRQAEPPLQGGTARKRKCWAPGAEGQGCPPAGEHQGEPEELDPEGNLSSVTPPADRT